MRRHWPFAGVHTDISVAVSAEDEALSVNIQFEEYKPIGSGKRQG